MEEKDKNSIEMIGRHSLAHVLARAVLKLFPTALPTIGPAIEDGFYYDFDTEVPFTADDLKKIEKEMTSIINKGQPFVREVISKQQALEMFKNNKYKVELINELPEGEEISIYRFGDFVDLCRGPHVESAAKLQNFGFKVAKCNAAYWRGNEKNKMLQRIYAYAFKDKKQLADHLNMLEEAKKRDHRKIGKEQELFFFDETAPGMAYWLPKGWTMLNTLITWWREEHQKLGYQEFSGPQLNSSELWKISGHWAHYKEDMFVLKDSDGREQALKPMNCPNSIKVFESKMRSYKDLPLRFSDVDVIHRNEKSGQLNGLFRVRMFRQDDSHNFVSEDQIGSEIKNILEIIKYMYGVFGIPYVLTLSTRPEDFMGEIETWNKAEADLKEVLTQVCGKGNFEINEGDGAFYGPKIDIKMKDCLGREWQMGTIQLDFQLPGRFGISYVGKDGEKKTPVMIHRAILGSFERFLGIMTEHFAGVFPVWLCPVQVKVMNISDSSLEFSKQVFEQLQKEGIKAELDCRNEKIGYKIREAQLMKIPYMIIIGDNEVETKTISIRGRGNENASGIKLENFIERLKTEIQTKKR